MDSWKAYKCIQPQEFLQRHVEQGARPDGRGSLSTFREVSISTNTISTSDSSAVVKQGNTVVVCGIKLQLAPPKASEPDKGFIVPNVELPSLCHSQFKPGPPSELAQAVTHFVHEVMTNCNLIDRQDLCLKPGKLAWVLYADIWCLNFDGNLVDAALKALVAALITLELPTIVFEGEDDEDVMDGQRDLQSCLKVDSSRKTPLKLNSCPVSCTMAVFEDRLLVDPTWEEEVLASSVVTVVLDAESGEICHLQKPGGSPLSRERLQECVAQAKKQAKKIRKTLDRASLKDVLVSNVEK